MIAIRSTLPSRHELLNRLISKRTPEEIDRYAADIVVSCDTIEQTTQELFETYQINMLP